MTIQEQLVEAQKSAMKSGDRATLSVIRQIQSEVAVAKTAPGFSGEIDDALYLSTIATYTKRMDKARVEYEALGERGADQAQKLAFEIDYLSDYLPQKLDDLRVIAAIETRSLSGYTTHPLMTALRRARRLLILQPDDPTDVMQAAGVKAPIRPGQRMTPGRGILVADRVASVIQVAYGH